MSLRNVLLIYLEAGDSTGYEIWKGFRNSYGYLWNASYQQVYRDLDKLHQDGLIDCQPIPQNGKPDQKRYRLNDRGRNALLTWMQSTSRPPRYNDAFMVKVASAHLLKDKKPLLDQLKTLQEKYQLYLDGLQSFRQILERIPETIQAEYGGAWLSLKRGIQVNQSWLDWSKELEQWLIDQIDQVEASTL